MISRIIHSKNRRVGDVLVLVEEVITIREVLRVVAYFKMDDFLMKSDSQIVINSIRSRSKVPTHIVD